MVQFFLDKLAGFVYRKYWLILFLSILLTGVSGYFASRLTFKSSFRDLLPDHFNSVKVLKEVTKKIGGIGYVTLIIHTDVIPQGEKYTAAIASEIEKVSEIRFVDYRLNIDFFKKNALLYMEISDLKEVLSRFKRQRDFEKKTMNPFFINLEDENIVLDFSDITKKYESKNINTNKKWVLCCKG